MMPTRGRPQSVRAGGVASVAGRADIAWSPPCPKREPSSTTCGGSCREQGGVPAETGLLLRYLSFHVGHRSVEFLAPHVKVVSYAMSIGARSRHTLNRPGCFFDLFVIQSAQRQLRRVERNSIGAVDR